MRVRVDADREHRASASEHATATRADLPVESQVVVDEEFQAGIPSSADIVVVCLGTTEFVEALRAGAKVRAESVVHRRLESHLNASADIHA